ncbi:MAG: hypothetical protein LIQ31_14110 [Planctomycetes bacterium]|nr:hypothetical protein [Planctomycetota bacterium]
MAFGRGDKGFVVSNLAVAAAWVLETFFLKGWSSYRMARKNTGYGWSEAARARRFAPCDGKSFGQWRLLSIIDIVEGGFIVEIPAKRLVHVLDGQTYRQTEMAEVIHYSFSQPAHASHFARKRLSRLRWEVKGTTELDVGGRLRR